MHNFPAITRNTRCLKCLVGKIKEKRKIKRYNGESKDSMFERFLDERVVVDRHRSSYLSERSMNLYRNIGYTVEI